MGPHLIIPQQCQPNCGKQDERRRRQPARRCSKAKPVAQHESAGSRAKVRIAEEEASHVLATVHIERNMCCGRGVKIGGTARRVCADPLGSVASVQIDPLKRNRDVQPNGCNCEGGRCDCTRRWQGRRHRRLR